MPKVLRSNSSEDGTDRPAVTDHAKPLTTKSLDQIATETGAAHAAQSEAKTTLEKRRKEFFKAVTNKHRVAPRAKRTVLVPQQDQMAAEEYVRQYHPGWTIINSRPDPTGNLRFILEEDPEYIGDQVITGQPENPGYVVTRTVRSGTTLIDLDRMELENPELYAEVTFVPEPERQPKPQDELTPEQLAKIAPYIYEDKKTVALNVRKAKPEDYEKA